jgi:hypothetical protein
MIFLVSVFIIYHISNLGNCAIAIELGNTTLHLQAGEEKFTAKAS